MAEHINMPQILKINAMHVQLYVNSIHKVSKNISNVEVSGATGEVHHTMLRLFSHSTSTLEVFIRENKVIGTDFSSTDIYLHVVYVFTQYFDLQISTTQLTITRVEYVNR